MVLLHSFSAPNVDIQEVSHKGTRLFKVEVDDGGCIAFMDRRK